MTSALLLLLAAVAYGVVLLFLFSTFRVAGAADQAADRALLAMLSQQRASHGRAGIGAPPPMASPARAAPRRRSTQHSTSLASQYR